MSYETQLRRYHVVFGGECQGVGFRFTAKLFADKLGVTGWVRNEYNGTVTCEMQGTSEQINLLFEELDTHFRSAGIYHTIEKLEEIPVDERDNAFKPKLY